MAQSPDPKNEQVKLKDGPISIESNIVENYYGTLDGIVDPDAKNLTFEFVDLFVPEDKNQGMRVFINFTDKSITFEQKIKNTWNEIQTDKIKHHFAPGVSFHLYFTMNKTHMVVNVNCYGEVPFPAVGGIDFKNRHRISIDGVKLSKDFTYGHHGTPVIDDAWLIKEGISAENSSGIVVRGKVRENAKKFSIKLWSRDAERFFKAMLELEVDILGPAIKYSEGKNPAIGVTFENGEHKYDAGSPSPFEALVQFNEGKGTFEIWMNNSKIVQEYNTTAGFGVVNYVQIIGDATGEMVQLPKTPLENEYIMSSESNCVLNIVGKVLPGIDNFNIQLKSESGEPIPLLFDAKFSGDDTSSVTLMRLYSAEVKTPEEFKDLMKIGEDFNLKIQYAKNQSEILVAINEQKYIFKSDVRAFVATNKYEISEGIIILENKPSLRCPCVPSMCPDTSEEI